MSEIESQIKLVGQIVRCIHMKRELTNLDSEPELNFWRLIYGGLLDLAVLEWTKIFGSNAEPSHWKGVVDDQVTFRKDLLAFVGISESEWEAYWKEMKGYRDEGVAHHSNCPSVTQYPVLDLALKSSYFYYSYLVPKYRAEGGTKYPDDIEEYCNRLKSQISDIGKLAIDATSGCQEKVF